MNVQKIEIVINQLERVYRDMNDCANRFILKDAIDQLQEQVKLFSIPDVVWRSEQLKAYAEYLQTRQDFQERSNKDLAIDFCDSL